MTPTLTTFEFNGEQVFIRHWSEQDRAAYATFAKKQDKITEESASIRIGMIVYSIVDADNKLIFDENDIGNLLKLPVNEISKAFNAILAIQKVDDDSELKKSSTPTLS